MDRLNRYRNALKHAGAFPGRKAVEDALTTTTSFFENNTPAVFGVAFDAIDMTDVVPQDDTRSRLKAAAAAQAAGDRKEAMAQPDEAFAELFYPYAGLPFGHAEAYGFAPTCGDMRLATGAPAVVVAAASLHRFRRCAVPRPVPRVTGRDLFIPNTERYSGQCGPNSCSSKLQCNRGARAQAYRLLQRRYPGRQTGRSRPRRRGQAIAQVLTPIFDPQFSGSSFGFRPGRSAHQAVRAARRCIADGLEWVVDIDLDRFFDRVQFDVLMARVARKVEDRRVDDTIVTDEPRECPCPAEPPSGTPRGRVRRAPWHTRRWRQPARWLAIRATGPGAAVGDLGGQGCQ